MARILVIDDENNIRLMVRLALQAASHQVEAASDGTEGLDKFAQGEDFDLVLLDQRMPGLDGLQVLREMRQRNASARVIMITAFGTIDLATEAIQAGAVDFLRKPFTTEVLRSAVQSALEHSQNSAAKTATSSSLRNTSINGFRICSSTRNQSVQPTETKGTLRYSFEVQALGAAQPCDVVLPNYFVELVKAHADRDTIPDPDHFWLWLCEESLANYLWQNAEIPSGGVLQVDELSTSLRRWINAILVK
jgi:DNA-binding response OmpR family regulator